MNTKEDKQYFKSGLMTFVFIYSLNKCGHYLKENMKTKREIRRLQKIPIKSLREAAKEVQNQQSPVSYFIEGEPQPGKLLSTFKKTPVILKIKQRSALFSTDSFLEPRIRFDWKKAAISQDFTIDRQPYFVLKDPAENLSANVFINDDTNIDSALMSFGFKDEKRSLSFAEHLGNFATIFYTSAFRILGPASLIQVLFRDASFRGVHIGYRDNEFGIRAEGILSVLGTLSFDAVSKQLKIQNPLILTLSKNKYLYLLEQKIEENGVARNFWLVVSFFSGLYLARRMFIYHKKHPEVWFKVKRFFKGICQKFSKKHRQELTVPLAPDERIAQQFDHTPTDLPEYQ